MPTMTTKEHTERLERELSKAQARWRAKHAKDPSLPGRVSDGLRFIKPKTIAALAAEPFADHPMLVRLVAEFGDFVRRVLPSDAVAVEPARR